MTVNTLATHSNTPVNSTVNQENNAMLPFDDTIVSFEDFHQTIARFRAFQADKANRPTYDKRYGTKYPGKLGHLHYAFYAILRGKSPDITTHDVNSVSYAEIKDELARVAKDSPFSYDADLAEAFGLSCQQIRHVIRARGFTG